MSRRKPPSEPVANSESPRRPAVGRRRKGLGEEDARLWAEVAKGLTPLPKRAERRRALRTKSGEPATPDLAAAADVAAAGTDDEARKQAAPRHGRGSHDTPPAQRRTPDLASFSRREMRHLANGHQPIEARLDLHGLRQAEAHVALKGFLVHSQSQGRRHVLVITGKGSSYNREQALFGEQEPGVLRRLVPLWLAEASLRDIVTGFTEAPLSQGGAGALYVRLRGRRAREIDR